MLYLLILIDSTTMIQHPLEYAETSWIYTNYPHNITVMILRHLYIL